MPAASNMYNPGDVVAVGQAGALGGHRNYWVLLKDPH